MSTHDAEERTIKREMDQGLIRYALHRGIDAGALVQVVDDFCVLEDRLEEVNAWVWLTEEIEPVEPEVGHINGRETGLFYRNAVNMLYGTDNCGKTLLMQLVVMQELELGNEVLYIDGEEGSPRNMFLRLQSMGCKAEWGSRLHYFNIVKQPSEQNRAMFCDIAKRCSLVVLDSAGELMGMHGKDATKDLETRGVLFELFGRPLAASGAAVVILDHISKSSDGSQPIGSIRKRAAIDGAAYFMNVEEGDEWSKTKSGEGRLTCQKDRNGTYHRGEKVAMVSVWPAASSVDGLLVVELSEYVELEDVIEVEDVPPAHKSIDVEALVIEIVRDAGSPVRRGYVQSELKLRGVEMTRDAVDKLMYKLAQGGWLHLDGKVGFTVALRSV